MVTVDRLRDQDGAIVTDATVNARLLDSDLLPVSGITWPVVLSHVSEGNYEGVIDKDMQLTENALYYLEITATSGALDATWRRPYVAAQRGAELSF